MRQSRFLLKNTGKYTRNSVPHRTGRAAAMCLAAVLIPYITTLAWTGHAGGNLQRPEQNGRTILLERGSSSFSMDLEEYLTGVLAVQISPEYEMEALKAQAILARTAVRRQMNGADSVPEAALDLDYLGQGQMEEIWGTEHYLEYYSRIQAAVAETTGQVATWNGNYIEPLFHSLSAGKTRQGTQRTPYLVSVDSPEAVEGENYLSVYLFSDKELASRLNAMTPSPELTPEQVLKQLQIVEKDSAGYVKSVMAGSRTYTGDAVRWALSLPSSAFHFENSESGVRCSVRGNGHGYGLEQYGANEKAKKGWTAEQILQFYYQNIVIVTE